MNKLDRPYILHEANWKIIREQSFETAVLPWGATEAHNFHLPYGTDNIQVEHVARMAAERCWEQGGKAVVLPCIPFGINTGQLDVHLCMNILPSTQMAILRDICDVLVRQKISKLVILNGHGGNHFKNMIREMSHLFPTLHISWVNWFQAVNWNDYFDEPGDHAGEMETSAVMHIAPDLVRPLAEAGDGRARPWKIKAHREGWAVSQREWTQVTDDTGVGNPKGATAQKGERYMKDCAEEIAKFLVQLCQTPNADLYE